ncbi:uncharacterized mitochondrial protein AtMg00310-like [Cannabis sativa]|uniref:uncharacterized mitochondrial protein AtMg00310-like n=1 Tax=Cannabis sativa TaxID=3483 RepID=UPI0029CA0C46|nr:uncharacterized mitochondrial protein AtMg00310-like [Cannabis sativa]
MARFWWGFKKDGHSMHWKNWNALCRSKLEGGLGFRNFIDFNQALLAKQAWRLVDNNDSLLYRTLYHRYFSRSTFLQARLGHNPPYTWRSILWGRDLLVKGLCWKVGTGSSISCASDPWLPGTTNFAPVLCMDANNDLRVSDLITADRTWDYVALHRHFCSYDSDRILSIPLSLHAPADKLIW